MSSINKVHAILELLRENYKTGLTNKEISITLKIPQSSCYRILASMKKLGYIQQKPNDMSYILGFVHLKFAQALIESLNDSAIVDPFLEDLYQKTGRTVFYAQFNGKLCVSLIVRGPVNSRISVGIGEIMPFSCSSTGKVVLAFLPDKQREQIYSTIDFTPPTPSALTNLGALKKNIRSIRETGAAFNLGEMHQGINSLSTPLFDRNNKVFGAFTLVGTAPDLPLRTLKSYVGLFEQASKGMTRAMGGQYPGWLEEISK
jgi:DNA-binding IclR family transcriptional regulator